jgi:hypothetical protein
MMWLLDYQGSFRLYRAKSTHYAFATFHRRV